MECAVVALEGEEVIASGKMDFLRDPFLAAHRIKADGRAFHIDLAQQPGDGGDLTAIR